jgi:hypothetical protein
MLSAVSLKRSDNIVMPRKMRVHDVSFSRAVYLVRSVEKTMGEVQEWVSLPTIPSLLFCSFWDSRCVCLCAHVYLFIETPLDSLSIHFFTVVDIKVMPLDVFLRELFRTEILIPNSVDLLSACDRMITNDISK